MFPVYGGKCLSRKPVHNRMANVSLITKRLKRSCGSGWDNSQMLLCCGFQCTGKATGQVYQCWWRICGEINVFSRFEYHMFYVLYPFVTYSLTLPHIAPFISEFGTGWRWVASIGSRPFYPQGIAVGTHSTGWVCPRITRPTRRANLDFSDDLSEA
jgi:hypothetical protein